MAVGDGVVGQVGGDQAQVEGARPADLGRPLDHARVAGEAAGLLRARAQAGGGGRRQPAVEVVEGPAGPHRGQGRGQGPSGGGGVVDVVGGHHVDPRPHGQRHQGVVAGRVEGVAVVPQLDGDVLPPEGVDQQRQLAGGGGRSVGHQGGRHRALAAAGEHLPPPAVGPGQVGQRRLGQPLLPRRHVGRAGGPAQAGVAVGVAGQNQQVAALGVGHPLLRAPGQVEGELGAEDGGHAQGGRRLGEPDHAVEAVVVGEGQGLEPEAGRLLGQLLGMGGPVEEAEVGVAVQLGVGSGAPPSSGPGLGRLGRRRRLVRGSLVGPGWAVTAVGGGRPPRQPPLELGPRKRRILPTHLPDCRRTYVRLPSA